MSGQGCAWQKHSLPEVPLPASGSSCHHYFARSQLDVPIHKGAMFPFPGPLWAAALLMPQVDFPGTNWETPQRWYAVALLLSCVLITRTSKTAGVDVTDFRENKINKLEYNIKFRVSNQGPNITSKSPNLEQFLSSRFSHLENRMPYKLKGYFFKFTIVLHHLH